MPERVQVAPPTQLVQGPTAEAVKLRARGRSKEGHRSPPPHPPPLAAPPHLPRGAGSPASGGGLTSLVTGQNSPSNKGVIYLAHMEKAEVGPDP